MYAIKAITWDTKKKGIREDLKFAPIAIALGYKMTTRNYFSVEHHGVPHDPISFVIEKDGVETVIWKIIIKWNTYWRACDYINDRACNHRLYGGLMAALETEAGVF